MRLRSQSRHHKQWSTSSCASSPLPCKTRFETRSAEAAWIFPCWPPCLRQADRVKAKQTARPQQRPRIRSWIAALIGKGHTPKQPRKTARRNAPREPDRLAKLRPRGRSKKLPAVFDRPSRDTAIRYVRAAKQCKHIPLHRARAEPPGGGTGQTVRRGWWPREWSTRLFQAPRQPPSEPDVCRRVFSARGRRMSAQEGGNSIKILPSLAEGTQIHASSWALLVRRQTWKP